MTKASLKFISKVSCAHRMSSTAANHIAHTFPLAHFSIILFFCFVFLLYLMSFRTTFDLSLSYVLIFHALCLNLHIFVSLFLSLVSLVCILFSISAAFCLVSERLQRHSDIVHEWVNVEVGNIFSHSLPLSLSLSLSLSLFYY